MPNEFEKYGMTTKERTIYEMVEMKLDRIIELLEKLGRLRPG